MQLWNSFPGGGSRITGAIRLASAENKFRDVAVSVDLLTFSIFKEQISRKKREGGPEGPPTTLAPETQLGDDCTVALDIETLDIVKKAATTTYQHEKPTTAVMVLFVDLQVLGEVIDAITEERNLYLGRTGIGLVGTVITDSCSFGRQVCCQAVSHNHFLTGYSDPASNQRELDQTPVL